VTNILPVILSGGSGSRLWPASRSMYPKQLLPLVGEKTMLQATALRILGLEGSAKSCLVVSNEDHRFSVAEQMNAIEMRSQIILEPEGRNTAPAVALAALYALERGDDAILLIMAADHVIENLGAFQAAVKRGVVAAEGDRLVTFGIVPTAPETGYGYVRANVENSEPVPVEEFIEKPDAETAQRYLDDGSYYWNSGMFLFRASAYLNELKKQAPEILATCKESMKGCSIDGDFIRPVAEVFSQCRSDSIDYAVMERSDSASMVSLDAGWSDVGSWSALQDVCASDASGNSLDGDAIIHNCENTFVQADSRLVAAVGLTDIIVVETKDAVLVANKDQSQGVKELVDRLKLDGRAETKLHRQVFRPWGSYDSLEHAEKFQVKRLIVKPGAILSLQKHAHRSEHWVVVQGKVRITKNDEEFDLEVNQSTYVAIGDVHRISNPYDQDAHIIEVQCGDYLGEDDIIRLEDYYGREGTNT